MMRIAALSLIAMGFALPVFAQNNDADGEFQTGVDQLIITPQEDNGIGFSDSSASDGIGFTNQLNDITTETQVNVSIGTGAELRALDKLTGEVSDLTVVAGQIASFGRLSVFLGECRYPKGNASGDAYAYMTINVEGIDEAVFTGWMVASSPALNAMDHARYDLWALSCKTS